MRGESGTRPRVCAGARAREGSGSPRRAGERGPVAAAPGEVVRASGASGAGRARVGARNGVRACAGKKRLSRPPSTPPCPPPLPQPAAPMAHSGTAASSSPDTSASDCAVAPADVRAPPDDRSGDGREAVGAGEGEGRLALVVALVEVDAHDDEEGGNGLHLAAAGKRDDEGVDACCGCCEIPVPPSAHCAELREVPILVGVQHSPAATISAAARRARRAPSIQTPHTLPPPRTPPHPHFSIFHASSSSRTSRTIL
jgi:hypothetical protein